MYKDLCISSSSADVFTMSEGYIVLPSNASYRLFPDNSNSKFTIQLERPLVLHSDKHEVALVDLHYNNTWKNLPDSRIILESRGGKRSTVNVAGGKYESYAEVCSSIQRELRLLKLEKRITIYHDEVTNTSYLRIRNNDRVTISEELSQVFGFESGRPFLVQPQLPTQTLPTSNEVFTVCTCTHQSQGVVLLVTATFRCWVLFQGRVIDFQANTTSSETHITSPPPRLIQIP